MLYLIKSVKGGSDRCVDGSDGEGEEKVEEEEVEVEEDGTQQ